MSDTIPSFPFRWPTPKNKMLICSLATGSKHMALLQTMAPTVAYYALLHSMDSLILPLCDGRLDASRPPAWDKIILIFNALKHYDTVMWIDADAMIVDPTRDICDVLKSKYLVHLVPEKPKGDWFYVNTGVWICQKDKLTFQLLEDVWNNTKFINSSCWEQDALMDLLGFNMKLREYRGPTRYTSIVGFLQQEWNAFPSHKVNNPVIVHHAEDGKKDVNMFKNNYDDFLKKIWDPK